MNKLMKMMKRALIVAGLALAVMSVSQTTTKAGDFPIYCGDQHDNVKATLENHRLIISGKGNMDDGEIFSMNGGRNNNDSIYNNDVNEIIIKEGVTSIGANAFRNLWKVTNVSIAKTVEFIGEGAFENSEGFYEINIPGSVKIIGDEAFSSTDLKECTLNKGLVMIGKGAFANTNISKIVIPDGITSIEGKAFNTTSLKKVVIPKNINVIASEAFLCVNATIYSENVLIGENAFSAGSEFTVERGSKPEKYAKNHYITIHYIKHNSVVTFDANGGTVSQKSKKVTSENRYGALPKPKWAGYEFVGWYTKPVNGKQKKATTLVTVTKNSTLYAHWKKVSVGKCSKPKASGNYTKQIWVGINSLKDVNGYQIRYGLKSSMKSSKIVNTGKTTNWLKKVKKNKKYYIQVRAYKKDSAGNKVYGAWSKKIRVKTRK